MRTLVSRSGERMKEGSSILTLQEQERTLVALRRDTDLSILQIQNAP